MDFFEREAEARSRSRIFSFLFLMAAASTIASVDLLAWGVWAAESRYFPIRFEGLPTLSATDLIIGATALTLVIMVTAVIQKSLALSRGGAAVAELMDGTRLTPPLADPVRRQLLDVVEEMAVAASLPVPTVYLLEREDGINAFVAGFDPEDAVVCVTQGALDALSRDELQAIVAHELSHVVNGDMTLNVQLTVQLHGLIVLSQIGRGLMNLGFGGRSKESRSSIAGAIGLLVLAVGSVGAFFGGLFKRAVSRERERLADAEAVQFTRNPGALVGALKKIGSLPCGAAIQSPKLDQVSHFLFVEPDNALGRRHPSLTSRIRAIEPDFDGNF